MRAGARIIKIGRDGKLKLKFVTPSYQDKLVSLFNTESISIKILSKRN
jgi:hypothetical protein